MAHKGDNDEHKKETSEHKLEHTYTFWYVLKRGIDQMNLPYGDALRSIGDFSTVEGFWKIYSHLVRPQEVNSPWDYFVFKSGIKPMWEDEQNRSGGQWDVHIEKLVTARVWETLLLAFIGEEFEVGDEITGVGVCIRDYAEHYYNVITVWNRNGQDEDIHKAILKKMMKILKVPEERFVYRRHDKILKKLRNQPISSSDTS